MFIHISLAALMVAEFDFSLMCHIVVSALFGNSQTDLIINAKSTDLNAWSAAKLPVAYSEPIKLAGKFIVLL
jgi:hypothetical protein